jgi:DNA-binding transcriptional ArsR family regulator
MPKLPTTRFFIKSYTDLLQGNLTAREVLIYGIIAEFESNKTPCFLSRAELAKRINESEATAERALQLLIKEGYVKAERKGRKRYLSTGYPQGDTPTLDLYQVDTQSVSKQGGDLYQVDTLTRSIITRSTNKTNINNININNNNINNINTNTKPKFNSDPEYADFKRDYLAKIANSNLDDLPD